MHRQIMFIRVWLLVYFVISLLSENRHLFAITFRTDVIIKSDLPCARLEIYRIFLSSNYRYPQIVYCQHFSGRFDASLRYLQCSNHFTVYNLSTQPGSSALHVQFFLPECKSP